jgi:DNA-directed RNA polymerase specialized sigma24 family protein
MPRREHTATAPLEPSEPSDEDLMVLVQGGDRMAYDRLYDRWGDRTFGFLLRRTGQRQAAEEAQQETWLRVYRWRDRFDAARPFRPWLYTLAANAGRDAREPEPWHFELPSAPGDPMGLRDTLISALHLLDEQDRRILLLVIEGFNATEVGTMLAMQPPAVRMRLMRARRQLREALHAK